MNGNFLKEKLQLIDIQLVDLSKKINITPQSLNSRFKTKDVTISFLIEICEAVKKSPYYFLKGSEYEKYFVVDNSITKSDIPTESSNIIAQKIELLEEQNQLLKDSKEQLQEMIVLYKEKINSLENKISGNSDQAQTA